jgi:hypothetical protein
LYLDLRDQPAESPRSIRLIGKQKVTRITALNVNQVVRRRRRELAGDIDRPPGCKIGKPTRSADGSQVLRG